ncbi:MAG: glycosyltransferase [Pyrinomonadaceae bacterium]
MRILHIYSGNLFGGIETMLVTFARAQARVPELQHEFALTFPGRLADELTATGALVHQLGTVRVSHPQTILRSRQALKQVLANGSFDGAICHGAWPYAVFASTVRRARLPVVFWAHDAMGSRHWTERWARRTKPDLVICNSEYTAGSGTEVWPGVPRRVIYCPVEAPARQLDPVARAEVRQELSTPTDATVILQASRMEAWKGHETHLDALGQLRDRTDWHCWMVGGPQRPHEAVYYHRLQSQAATLGIGDRVHFLGQRADVSRLMAAADVFCQPNLSPEPFGIVFIESLYAGLPVVTSAGGGAQEIVDETCGILVLPGDVQALTAALRSLLEDPARRNELSVVGPQRAAEVSDPVQQSRRLHETLAAALALADE